MERRATTRAFGAAAPDYVGAGLERLQKVSFELAGMFEDAGFTPIEPAILQPAEPLFDLYGEEMWDRAFVVDGGDGASWCLRPDFTVPVARTHLARMAAGDAPAAARYGYFGPVFRRARDGASGPLQHLQAGVELIDTPEPGPAAGADAAARDAELFRLCVKAVGWLGVERPDIVTGDLGVSRALLAALDLPATWRRRLERHLWRPARFHEILRAYGAGAAPELATRIAFLKGVGALEPAQASVAVGEMLAISETPQIGVRGVGEVAERFLALAADARRHPLSGEVIALLEAALGVSGPSGAALARLRDLARAGGVDIAATLDRFEARLAAMTALGLDADALPFDADFGRNLEYYDGFVFELTLERPDGRRLKLGGGGRYDRLFRALGAARPIAAVGAALRPESLVEALG